jgi:hypothetical protein
MSLSIAVSFSFVCKLVDSLPCVPNNLLDAVSILFSNTQESYQEAAI